MAMESVVQVRMDTELKEAAEKEVKKEATKKKKWHILIWRYSHNKCFDS